MPETSGGSNDHLGSLGTNSTSSGGGFLSNTMYSHPMSVFLSPQYRNLSLFEMKGEEDSRERAEIIQQLRAQRAVESFFNDGCLVRAATMGVGGGLVGILLGAFLFTMKPVDVNTTLGLRAQLREQYKTFVPEVASTAKNFAKIGGLYSFSECIIDRCGQCSSSMRFL
ncbi:mitochondrial import inner membrane translocase subunit Tim17 domain-contraining protein, putative [Eimeria necatrix]|uniref:Mitochondrial import inner membrane translocase subunit Tim17 domain-contraining protein, putative n=1 Tax=Eimeria necatrix TaxID=51315 RepID=U6MIM3_9EIME|nr:mitochondrial import inner membrane translocase subunit Tim17 domain-contraining protein, putative [Eimeria necatrix]CDJ63876.1 mitochondrial import inner membrane translocase subunit Tim17 domain-contraining protein, putative [Eimeria necatrix]